MNDNKDKIKRLNKLKALAEQGVGGEKIEAAKLLNKLLKKYYMSEADLGSEEVREIEITFKNKEEKTLLFQVCYKVFITQEACYEKIYHRVRGKGSRNTKIIKCTPSEAAQIILFYDFYRDLWEREKAKMLEAFIQKNRLFGESTKDGGSNMSDEEIAELLKHMSVFDEATPPSLRISRRSIRGVMEVRDEQE